jgi:rRNA-processing protein FCF1
LKTKPTILLDEPILGMDVYLRDLGWDIVTIRETIGSGKSDDAIIGLAKKEAYVLVTTDRKLAKRCRMLDIGVVEVGVEDYARAVHQKLTKEFSG